MIRTGKGWAMHLGDCATVMRSLPDVDHVITDPPYEAEAHTKQRRVMRAGGIAKVEALDFEPMTELSRAVCASAMAKLVRRWCIAFCQVEGAMRWAAALEPLVTKRIGVWIKPDGMPQLTGDRPGMGYESIVFAHAKGRSKWNGGGRPGVFVHNKSGGERSGTSVRNEHPTTKPLPLMIELAHLFTYPGETVLDPFAGSGTTGVACLRCGVNFVGIERDPKYFELACERLRSEELGLSVSAVRDGQLNLLGNLK